MKPARAAAAIIAIVAVVIAVELALGRVPVCACGTIKLWHGVVYSSENSQHITDWYTFSHVLHGMAFYGLLWIAARQASAASRFVAAVAIEGVWEMLENSPFIIDRYRTATIALDYYGDSILNSVSDIVAMALGFWLTLRLPVWLTIAAAIVTEVTLAYLIRDNLTLNIIMLISPVDAIKQWQMGQ